jgi:hypothetical protein
MKFTIEGGGKSPCLVSISLLFYSGSHPASTSFRGFIFSLNKPSPPTLRPKSRDEEKNFEAHRLKVLLLGEVKVMTVTRARPIVE